MARGYRTNDYSFVIDNSFQPFSMQEMLMPFLSYKEAYEKQEAAYQDLVDKTDTFKYLERVAEENPDSKAAQIYKGYADEMNRQFSDFSQNGLSMANRRALTNLKKRYQGEIGRLMKADEAMSKERELRRAMNGKDSSMLYATDNLNIDDFLDGSNPNLYNISGTELYTRGAAAGKAASSRVYSAGDEGSTLNGYYRKWVERNGYSKESMDAFRANASAIPELQQAADAILAERGVLENLNGSNLERARQSVLNGIIDGAVYQESVKPVRDEGKMSAAAATQYSLQREGMERQAAAQGLVYDRKNKTFKYDVRNDPKYAKDLWMYTIDDKTGQITGYSKEYEEAVKSGLIKGGTNSPTNITTKFPRVNPADFQKLLINNGVTSNGTILTGEGSDVELRKLDTSSSARYMPFYGDALNRHAEHGFDVKEDSSGYSDSDAKPYSIDRLKSDEARQQLRDYVQELIPDVVDGLTQDQLDEVIGYMDFYRDYDWLTDNHFKLSIPGTDEEGKIVDKNKFNRFLTKVNQMRIKTIQEGFTVGQQIPAGYTESSDNIDNTIPVIN